MHKGAGLVLKTVKAIETGNPPSHLQPENVPIKHAPKIFKETCEIQWTQSSDAIRNFVRGLNPCPAAWTTIQDKLFKIYQVQPMRNVKAESDWVTDQKTYLYHKTADGWISITELQPEGKKRMTIEEFFRGNKLTI